MEAIACHEDQNPMDDFPMTPSGRHPPLRTTNMGLSSRRQRFAMNFFRDHFRGSSADYSRDFRNLTNNTSAGKRQHAKLL